MRELLKNCALVIGSIIVFFSLAEGFCRLLPFAQENGPLDPQNFRADRAAESDTLLGYVLRKGIEVSGYRYNSLGFAGPDFNPAKPANTYRIICLGGSTTLGTGAGGDRYSYPSILQSIFDKTSLNNTQRVEIINGGVFGYHSWHTALRVAKRLDEYSPDMYLVMDGLNDLAAAKSMTLTKLIELGKDDNGPLAVLAAKPPFLSSVNNYLSGLSFYRVMRNILAGAASKAQVGYGMERIQEKFQHFGYASNIERAARHALDHSIQFVLIGYPWKVGLGPQPWEKTLLGIHPEHEALYRIGRHVLPQTNAALSKELNVPLIDPQPVFDSHPPTRQGINRIWSDDIHFTRYGNYLLAREVYKSLMRLPTFQKLTGRDSPLPDDQLDALFPSLLDWAPADGQGWPGPSWEPVASELILENIKDGPKDEGSGFTALVPADPASPGRITVTIPDGKAGSKVALYARVSGGGDQVDLFQGGTALFTLANRTGDGLWSPMAGWYEAMLPESGRAELVLSGANAQVWGRNGVLLFQAP